MKKYHYRVSIATTKALFKCTKWHLFITHREFLCTSDPAECASVCLWVFRPHTCFLRFASSLTFLWSLCRQTCCSPCSTLSKNWKPHRTLKDGIDFHGRRWSKVTSISNDRVLTSYPLFRFSSTPNGCPAMMAPFLEIPRRLMSPLIDRDRSSAVDFGVSHEYQCPRSSRSNRTNRLPESHKHSIGSQSRKLKCILIILSNIKQ